MAETGLKRRRRHGWRAYRPVSNFQVSEDRPPERKPWGVVRWADGQGEETIMSATHGRWLGRAVSRTLLLLLVALVAAVAGAVPGSRAGAAPKKTPPGDPPGNNGTVKIDADRPGSDPNDGNKGNEPHRRRLHHLAGVLRLRPGPDGRHHLHRPSAERRRREVTASADKARAGQPTTRPAAARTEDAVIAYNLTSAVQGLKAHQKQGYHIKLSVATPRGARRRQAQGLLDRLRAGPGERRCGSPRRSKGTGYGPVRVRAELQPPPAQQDVHARRRWEEGHRQRYRPARPATSRRPTPRGQRPTRSSRRRRPTGRHDGKVKAGAAASRGSSRSPTSSRARASTRRRDNADMPEPPPAPAAAGSGSAGRHGAGTPAGRAHAGQRTPTRRCSAQR